MNIIDQNSFLALAHNQARLFKALGHPVRLLILSALRDGEHCVCHLEAHLGLRQAYLSQQLGVLRRAGLVKLRRDGWNRYYRVVDQSVFALLDGLAGVPSGLPALRLEPNPLCPCPCCAQRVHPEVNEAH